MRSQIRLRLFDSEGVVRLPGNLHGVHSWPWIVLEDRAAPEQQLFFAYLGPRRCRRFVVAHLMCSSWVRELRSYTGSPGLDQERLARRGTLQ